MDVSSKSLVVHAINERKQVVWRGEVAASRSGLKRAMQEVGEQPKRVVFEAGNQIPIPASAYRPPSHTQQHPSTPPPADIPAPPAASPPPPPRGPAQP